MIVVLGCCWERVVVVGSCFGWISSLRVWVVVFRCFVRVLRLFMLERFVVNCGIVVCIFMMVG